MERTVCLRLQITTAHDAAARATTAQFTASLNHVCAVGWQQRNGNAYTLHHLTYHDCKTANPALVSDLHMTTADLLHRHGRWCLHVIVQSPDMPWVDNGTALGVDLGITHPAVTSDNRFHGRRHWREVTRRRFRLQRTLQSNGSKMQLRISATNTLLAGLVQLGASMYPLLCTGSRGKTPRSLAPNWRGICGTQY